ncbi:MAG: sodium:solute symporter family transporter [Candidatus Aminicenantales bacterium]
MNAAMISFLAYTGVLAALGIWSFRIVEKVPIDKYEQEFYAAGRGLGGVVVALVIAGGLASAGTFIAGPGMTYAYGYSWVMINNFQIFMNLLLLAPVGIIVGVVARRVNAVTYLDLFKVRYQSKAVVLLLAALVTFFLIPYMATQFVGAARVISQMTGLGYLISLAFGSVVVLVYCVLGGMRGTSLATLLQGVVITAGCIMLFVGTVQSAGGFGKSTDLLAARDASFLSPTKNGEFPPAFAFSVACMTGFFIVGMPHAMLGALTYRNTRALKRGIWMGGIFVCLWTLLLCLSGVVGRSILPDLAVPDEIAPWLAMNVMPRAMGGVVLAGIVAGIQTTVAAMAVIITSSIAKNVLEELKPNIRPATTKAASRWTMATCLGLAIGLAISQPKLIQWIIFFSIGGLEAATFGPILIGFNWRRGNKQGALAAIGSGMIVYALANTVCPWLKFWGMHPSFVAVLAAGMAFVVASLLSSKPADSILRIFWGTRPSPDPFLSIGRN